MRISSGVLAGAVATKVRSRRTEPCAESDTAHRGMTSPRLRPVGTSGLGTTQRLAFDLHASIGLETPSSAWKEGALV
jgi:hypothetical protein